MKKEKKIETSSHHERQVDKMLEYKHLKTLLVLKDGDCIYNAVLHSLKVR